MLIREIIELLEAEILVNQAAADREIQFVHASDLISEVLASCSRGALWLTGLLDHQIINTAELFDLSGVIFVGNRRPDERILEAAREEGIPVMITRLTMFETCGLLYSKGLLAAKRAK
ncbi:hypothetical protein JXA40_01405 [bacterium]|nr:hypothetical protein [candidate division CSSED10-310 bacterium]